MAANCAPDASTSSLEDVETVNDLALLATATLHASGDATLESSTGLNPAGTMTSTPACVRFRSMASLAASCAVGVLANVSQSTTAGFA